MRKLKKQKCIGIDISSEQLIACAVSKRGKILHYVGIENDDNDLAGMIVDLVEKLLEDSGIDRSEILHIGIGSREGSVPGNLKETIENALDITCRISNEN